MKLRTAVFVGLVVGLIFNGASIAQAAMPEKLLLIVPGGAGGGWDTTARTLGQVLLDTGAVKNVEYENVSGGGGGRGLKKLIDEAATLPDSLMVTSMAMTLRGVTGEIPATYKDITPVAAIIGDHQVLAVRADSPIQDLKSLIEKIKADPNGSALVGGSARGSLDHVAAALVLSAAGGDAKTLRFVPGDGGADALAKLISQPDIIGLSTGLGEALAPAKEGKLRILATIAELRHPDFPDVPTAKESGYDAVISNWRGFFAVPNLAPEKLKAYQEGLAAAIASPQWQAAMKVNGWIALHKDGEAFASFLREQDQQMLDLIQKIGLK